MWGDRTSCLRALSIAGLADFGMSRGAWKLAGMRGRWNRHEMPEEPPEELPGERASTTASRQKPWTDGKPSALTRAPSVFRRGT